MKKQLLILLLLTLSVSSYLLISDMDSEQIKRLENASAKEEKAAIVFGKDIFSKDLYSANGFDSDALLALTIESEMLQNLERIYNIDASSSAIEEWLRKERPKIANDKAYRKSIESSQNIYDALLSVRSGKVSETDAYEKYVQSKIDKKSWLYLLKQYKNESDLEFLKKELDVSKEKLLKEIASYKKITFLLEKVQKKICNSKPTVAKLKEATTRKLAQYSKLSSKMENIEKIVQAKKKSYCRIFALEELSRLQKDNVTIINPELKGAIFQTKTYRQWQFFKRELP